MYTEEYEKRGFPLSFLMKVIIVLLFFSGIIFLITKIILPTAFNKNVAFSTNDKSIDNILSSQIFIHNLERIKTTAIEYYTMDKLPKENNQSVMLTLKEMIDKKLLIALIDKNNQICDEEKSYAKVTKENDRYILKVNLKDSEKEEYILVDLGYYM